MLSENMWSNEIEEHWVEIMEMEIAFVSVCILHNSPMPGIKRV